MGAAAPSLGSSCASQESVTLHVVRDVPTRQLLVIHLGPR